MTQSESGQVLEFDPSAHHGKQLAALDLGSNSFHLLIAQESHGRIQVIDKFKEMVRLAEGLTDDGPISPKVANRALAFLELVSQRLRSIDPANVRIVGTNTLRQAKDQKFMAKAEEILGHKIEIISGREEARLIFMGVCHDLGGESTRRLVVDIGGGSTELILGRMTTPETLESLHMGCVSMSQRFFADGRIDKKSMNAAIKHALVELEPVAHEFVSLDWESAVGASGTINTVSDVLTPMTGSDLITPTALKQLKQALIDAGSVDKLDLEGLSDERKAVFAGGVAILSAIFDALKIREMTAAQAALREGLIYDLLGRQHEDDAREHTVESLIQRYRIDAIHARQVRETAITLLAQIALDWDLVAAQHKLSLAWAASLHEIGMDISHSGYHKHGEYLLENMDLPGFSRSEQRQLAILVRSHRRKLVPELFSDQQDLLRLAVILRLAIVLHRSRSHTPLPHIELKANDKKITLSLPKAWLEDHPLTAEDFANEAKYLQAIELPLHIKTQ